MSGKESEREKERTKIGGCGWANAQRQRYKGRLASEQAHYVNTSPKEMWLLLGFFVCVSVCVCVSKKNIAGSLAGLSAKQ